MLCPGTAAVPCSASSPPPGGLHRRIAGPLEHGLHLVEMSMPALSEPAGLLTFLCTPRCPAPSMRWCSCGVGPRALLRGPQGLRACRSELAARAVSRRERPHQIMGGGVQTHRFLELLHATRLFLGLLTAPHCEWCSTAAERVQAHTAPQPGERHRLAGVPRLQLCHSSTAPRRCHSSGER